MCPSDRPPLDELRIAWPIRKARGACGRVRGRGPSGIPSTPGSGAGKEDVEGGVEAREEGILSLEYRSQLLFLCGEDGFIRSRGRPLSYMGT